MIHAHRVLFKCGDCGILGLKGFLGTYDCLIQASLFLEYEAFLKDRLEELRIEIRRQEVMKQCHGTDRFENLLVRGISQTL